MLDYNVPGGKLNRGMAVLDVLNALKNSVRAFSLSMQLRAQMNPRLTSCSNAAVNTGSLIMGCVFYIEIHIYCIVGQRTPCKPTNYRSSREFQPSLSRVA